MTRRDRFVLGPLARNIAWSLVVAGAAAIAAGLAVDPRRTWPTLLIDGFYTIAIAVAGVVFIALQFLTGATWNANLRRIPEALMAALPAAGVMMLALFFGRDWIYAAHHAVDEAAAARTTYFGAPLFFGRMALFVAVWALFARLIRRASLQQDRQRDDDGAARQHERLIRYSAMFTVVFAISFSLASFDWLMSVVPRWTSTIFAVYWFAGVLSGGTAAITLAAVLLAERGYLAGIVDEARLHDLGKLLLAFTTFWAYIWLSQYLLIWYGNVPEEAAYYVSRTNDRWIALFLLNLVLNWVAPFFVLLPRDAKRSAAVLKWIAVVVLAGRWLDLYLTVMPEMISAPSVRPLDVVILCGYGAAVFLIAARALASAPLVPRFAVAAGEHHAPAAMRSDHRV
jgi:hypothetical protein